MPSTTSVHFHWLFNRDDPIFQLFPAASECTHTFFWLVYLLSIWSLSSMSPITRTHVSRISKDRGHRINLDLTILAIWLSGISIEKPDIRREFCWLPAQKEVLGGLPKRKWSLNLGAWNHQGQQCAHNLYPHSSIFAKRERWTTRINRSWY